MTVILLIEDMPWRSAGEAAVRDAASPRRGAGRGGAKMRSILGGPRILDRRFDLAGTLNMTETRPLSPPLSAPSFRRRDRASAEPGARTARRRWSPRASQVTVES